MEQWREIEGWPYSVSDEGRVRNDRTGHILKLLRDRYGYNHIELNHVPRIWRVTVHRLVMAAFIGPRPPSMEVNHSDGVKTNNAVNNLEYVTQSENAKHAFATGLNRGTPGERDGNAKLTAEHVLEIRRRYAAGELQADLGRAFGVHHGHISQIVLRNRWRHI